MLTGLGATETAPFFMSVNPLTSRSGHVGLPVLGNEAKLVPNNGKLEVRAKGPNVMPGYWRQPDMTAKAFDEEGFYKMGDALKPVDPDNFDAGFDFDGRTGEDFKLASGTWVSVGPLRARFVTACAPLVRDVVIAGINRDDIGAGGARPRRLPPDQSNASIRRSGRGGLRSADRCGLPRTLPGAGGWRHGVVDPDHARGAARSTAVDRSRRGHRQGSINQRAVLENRAALIEEIYSPVPPAQVITLS
jgi:feruloyl-CoA synthase